MKVCVIGAGPCGLTTLKALRAAGLDAECFEKSDRVGGIWALETSLGKTSAYRSLHINTSRERSQFSDFPMPAHYPDFPDQAQMARYFERYAEHFELRRAIHLSTPVKHVRPLASHDFLVTLESGAKRSFGALAVANGHHSEPYWPPVAGRFGGVELHACQYMDPDTPHALRGKRVLVVGMGNSAMDIAAELAYAGSQVTLSMRRGAYIVPKWVRGQPVDQASLLPRWLPRLWRRRFSQYLLDLAVGDLARLGVQKPDHQLGEAHPTLSSDVPMLIRTGRIVAKPALLELSDAGARFADQSSERLDAIVYCTGYNVSFPFFDEDFVSAADNDLPLFLRVHKPGIENLFFMGLCQPVGAIMPIAEAQGRWIAEQLTGGYLLPHPSEMQLAIERASRETRHYVRSRRHTMQLDPDRYLSELQRERERGQRRALHERSKLRERAPHA